MTAPNRVTVWNEFWHENPEHWDYVQVVLDEPRL